MKLSKKVIAAFSAAAALALAGTFVGCKSDDEDPYNLITVSGDNATVEGKNDGTLTDADGKVATDATFIRGFKTQKTTGWKAAVYKLTISKDSEGGVLGWIFDEENATPEGATEKNYSFYLLGLKATSGSPSIYFSRFNDVKQSELSGSGTSFGEEFTLIDSGSTSPASGSKWYKKLDAEAFGYDSTTGYSTVYVAFRQPNKDGRYAFGIFAEETAATSWFNDNKVWTTGDGHSESLITEFNAVNGTTFTSHYGQENTINDFGIAAAGEVRDKQVGFYAMIPKGGSLTGTYNRIDYKLADEVVEE